KLQKYLSNVCDLLHVVPRIYRFEVSWIMGSLGRSPKFFLQAILAYSNDIQQETSGAISAMNSG
ncbi:hypothetical protein ACH5RR_029636, partial [Cinchona calisaya]